MGRSNGGKTFVACRTISTSVVTVMMKSTPATTDPMDLRIMTNLLCGGRPYGAFTQKSESIVASRHSVGASPPVQDRGSLAYATLWLPVSLGSGLIGNLRVAYCPRRTT